MHHVVSIFTPVDVTIMSPCCVPYWLQTLIMSIQVAACCVRSAVKQCTHQINVWPVCRRTCSTCIMLGTRVGKTTHYLNEKH